MLFKLFWYVKELAKFEAYCQSGFLNIKDQERKY